MGVGALSEQERNAPFCKGGKRYDPSINPTFSRTPLSPTTPVRVRCRRGASAARSHAPSHPRIPAKTKRCSAWVVETWTPGRGRLITEPGRACLGNRTGCNRATSGGEAPTAAAPRRFWPPTGAAPNASSERAIASTLPDVLEAAIDRSVERTSEAEGAERMKRPKLTVRCGGGYLYEN